MELDAFRARLRDMAADLGFIQGVVEGLCMFDGDTIKEHLSSLRAIHERADSAFDKVREFAECDSVGRVRVGEE